MTIELTLNGESFQGTPVSWNSSRVLFLARNGFLLDFAPTEPNQFQQVSPHFRPWSQQDMRGQLLKEFGRDFEVSGTGNYLVVHPRGEADRWPRRFDALYRSFVHYFTVRGMTPAAPEFPLVAVVFHSRKEFLEHANRSGSRVGRGILGYYSPRTNRVMIHDLDRGGSEDENWSMNAKTVIHEATHQLAFNTHIHSRVAEPPRWVAEGLAMMFETPGVWDPHYHPHRKDRVNPTRLEAFRQYAPRRPQESLAPFVSQSAREFGRTPAVSYAQAWAFSFFLSEREPAKYMEYLKKTASRQPLKTYTNAERLKEFTTVFGQDLGMLEARFLRFIEELP
ncbi:MAG: DUF1570 domain-containing protein [Planctomycetota bacterium]